MSSLPSSNTWSLTRDRDYNWRGPSLINSYAINISVSNVVYASVQDVTDQIWGEVREHIGNVWQGTWYE